jgi:dTDP-4-dehydrorhamnose reductase
VIVILGASGYVGREFARQLESRSLPFHCLGRRDCDLYQPGVLSRKLRELKAEFVINCAGYTGKPNVDACELHRAECLEANAVLPGKIAAACEMSSIPWGHVSSGCVFSGAREDGSGFVETDPPNFSFRTNHCSFYSGSKALGEEILSDSQGCYIWRLRIPFDHRDSPRNYLSKILNYERLLSATNSLSHLEEFVNACIQCWTLRVPQGIYNVVNTGSVTTERVTELLREHLVPNKQFRFFSNEDEFMRVAAKTPRSNCVLDNSKLRATGIPMSDVEDAIRRALKAWEPREQVLGVGNSSR